MEGEPKLNVYEKYACMKEEWVKEVCNYVNQQCSLDPEKNISLIEPGCGPGMRGVYFIKYLNFKKYFGIDIEALDKGLVNRFKEKLNITIISASASNEEIVGNYKSKEIHLIKKDFLCWDAPQKEKDEKRVVILSFFLHWLKSRWIEGIRKSMELEPDYIILMGGGMPSFPVAGVKYLLPYYRDLLTDKDTLEWFEFLFSLQRKIENDGINMDRWLFAQDYLSRIEEIILNGYTMQNFRIFKEWEKEFKRDSVINLYKEDPLNLLPPSKRSEVITKVESWLDKKESIKWRFVFYVAVLGSRENH